MNPEANKLFKQGIFEKDIFKVMTACNQGADVNMIISRNHGNALMYSVCVGNWEVVDALTDAEGIDLNYVDEDNFSILTVLAVHFPDAPSNEALVAAQIIINMVDPKLFIIPVRIIGSPKDVPLTTAIRKNKIRLAKMMVEKMSAEDLIALSKGYEPIKFFEGILLGYYGKTHPDKLELFAMIKNKIST